MMMNKCLMKSVVALIMAYCNLFLVIYDVSSDTTTAKNVATMFSHTS